MRRLSIILIFLLCNSFAQAANEREEKLRADKQRFETKADWIYNDLASAFQQAKSSGRPIMAVLRCVPCEECVKLDDDLIDNDRVVGSLMQKFVRVRLTGTNGLDLKTFQYDTDQSFAIFFLNADKVVYGRFGTRSHRTEWVTDVSVEGMARAMEAALKLHGAYPSNRQSLLAKSNQPVEYATPEQFPTLRKKPRQLNWKGRDFAKGLLKTCIHCHEISEARMEHHLKLKKPLPQSVLYPYPHPKSVGIVLDPDYPARVEKVIVGSLAARAGLKVGDDILQMNGQPLISMADVQWVLHHLAADGATVSMEIKRSGASQNLSMILPSGWRKADDTSWRTGHWMLRRSMLGGMKLTQDGSDLRVQYAGSWGPFGVAHRAGIRKGDVIVSVDGRRDLRRESDVFDYVNENKQSGEMLNVVARRGQRDISAAINLQW